MCASTHQRFGNNEVPASTAMTVVFGLAAAGGSSAAACMVSGIITDAVAAATILVTFLFIGTAPCHRHSATRTRGIMPSNDECLQELHQARGQLLPMLYVK
jgi:hypothetical protein